VDVLQVLGNEKGLLSEDVGGLNAEMQPTHPQERSATECEEFFIFKKVDGVAC